jgi:predicted RNase H-like nuclease (RuvC/YqgF family)
MTTDDTKALQLAEAGIKRDSTLGELDLIRVSKRAIWKSLEARLPAEGKPIHEFVSQLKGDDTSQSDAQELHQKWGKALAGSTTEFQEMVAELQRLNVQEKILEHMLEVLDRQIEKLKGQLR